MKKSYLYVTFIFIWILGFFIFGCSSDKDKTTKNLSFTGRQGSLPVLKTGDTWTMGYTYINETQCKIINQVAGEDIVNGKSCYFFNSLFEPPLLPQMLLIIDKSSLDIISMSSLVFMEEDTFETSVNYTYTYFDSLMFPLETGKTWKVKETESIMATISNETTTQDTTNVYTYIVEKMEEIKVPAGTFNCFRIVKYNEDGKKEVTLWYSDDVKSTIKELEHKTGEDMELISYSVTF